ncbi:MAG: sigma-70 family RNA polymerase sigma factor [Planctomycetota bacterium]
MEPTGNIESPRGKSERFVRQLTEHQNRLYGYVYSLLGDHARASDVVQETNLVLWRKIDEFDPEKPFVPWAFATARFQVLAHLRDQNRDRVLLDAELAESLSGQVSDQASQIDSVRQALRGCMQRLSEEHQQMLHSRYSTGKPIAEMATISGRSVSSIKVSLMRIRRQLSECIENRLATEADK